jgi:pheromone shutdown protein TraB
VAVVGAGHVPGMKKVWHDDIPLADLLSMPEKRKGVNWASIVGWGSVGVFCVSAIVLLRIRRSH